MSDLQGGQIVMCMYMVEGVLNIQESIVWVPWSYKEHT